MTPAQADWARCRDWIKAAVEPTGLYTIEDVEAAIADGTMSFWPGDNCAAVTEFCTYPNCKVLNVFAGGGLSGKALPELRKMEKAFVFFARAADCTKIIGFGLDAAWRPVTERMGYRHLWTAMVKDIEE